MAAPTTTIAPETELKLGQERGELVSLAGALTITSSAEYERAGRHLTTIKALLGKIRETFDPIVRAAHEAHRIATSKRAEHADPLLEAERTIKGKMGSYLADEERKRRAEEARLAAIAREQEEQARLEEAVALEAAGEGEAALAVLEEPALPPPPPVAAQPPRASGVSARDSYSAEVTDLLALVRAVAEGKAPVTYLLANTSTLNQWAKATRGTVKLPGVVVRVQKIMSARST